MELSKVGEWLAGQEYNPNTLNLRRKCLMKITNLSLFRRIVVPYKKI
jgi:hypothetical protein